MVVNNRYMTDVGKVQQNNRNKSINNNKIKNTQPFSEILSREIDGKKSIKFSRHAQMRLEDRNINLSDSQIDRLNNAVDKAEKKGIKDSLIMVDDIALIVSVRNKTVITAADSAVLKDSVFTNIDGAVFS